MRYHVRNNMLNEWKFEETELKDIRVTVSLLARILVGKIEDNNRLVSILRNLPVQNRPEYTCRTWIRAALEELAKDGQAVGVSQMDWTTIETFARRYVAQKTAAGRYEGFDDVLKPKPTWNLIEAKETVP